MKRNSCQMIFGLFLFFVFISLNNNLSAQQVIPGANNQNLSGMNKPAGLAFGEKYQKNPYTFSKKSGQKSATILPEVYDLRVVDGGKYLSTVKDQGNEGTCWAFATYGAVESYWLKQGKGQYDFSELHLATCNGFNSPISDGGTAYMSAAYFARLNGAVDELADPYIFPLDSECIGWVEPLGYITQARFLPGKVTPGTDLELLSNTIQGRENLDMDMVKQNIMEYGALYINMYMNDGDFFNPEDNTYYYCGLEATNHAILLVGWDDNKLVTGNGITKPKSKGAWICRNSYGNTWGEDGFFYISYEDTRALSVIACFPSAINYDNRFSVLQYDDLGFESTHGFDSNTAFGLVKFSSDSEFQLSSIGMFIPAENESIEVEIYDQFTNLVLSNKRASLVAQAGFPGYYTFQLDLPINIPPNDDFYVKVKFETDDSERPLAIENSAAATIETDKFWIKNFERDAWIPIGEGTQNRFDLCIKAYGYTQQNTFADLDYDQEFNAVSNTNCTKYQTRVFPNPATNTITISGIEVNDLAKISIINLAGIEVLNAICNQSEITISLSQIPEGVYYVMINGKNQMTYKLLKIK